MFSGITPFFLSTFKSLAIINGKFLVSNVDSSKIAILLQINTITGTDVLGSEVTTLLNENKDSGIYEAEFYTEGLPSGIYFYRVVTGNTSTGQGDFFAETKKMILLR